ncbi:MAG TPA: PASTA domain-containing protein [Gemmatimonadaceae bacterium]|jgi:serine/threonine-protein kinase|nr:PASTA domain-containing protein [Gemmatimonadaceae bacterium]
MNWRAKFRTSLVYLVSIVAGFTLAYLLVAFVVFPAGVIPRDVKVPNVTGLEFDEAAQRLAQAGFKAEQGEQRYNNSAPKMTVLEQSPPPGTRTGVGDVITLVVSGGQRLVAIPAVGGMTRAEAQAQLEKDGFDVGEATEAPSNAPRGTVIATRPAIGTAVGVPTTVSLVLSGGAPAQQMPDLTGRDVNGARQVLVQLGVKDIKVTLDPTSPGTPGTVIGQSPVSGATIASDMTVQLRVVGEPPAPTDPNPMTLPPAPPANQP